MNRILWLLMVAGLLAGSGCATRYDVTLSTGNKITAKHKPRLVEGNYVFTDVMGQERRVPAMRVRVIEPQPRGWSKEPTFR